MKLIFRWDLPCSGRHCCFRRATLLMLLLLFWISAARLFNFSKSRVYFFWFFFFFFFVYFCSAPRFVHWMSCLCVRRVSNSRDGTVIHFNPPVYQHVVSASTLILFSFVNQFMCTLLLFNSISHLLCLFCLLRIYRFFYIIFLFLIW